MSTPGRFDFERSDPEQPAPLPHGWPTEPPPVSDQYTEPVTVGPLPAGAPAPAGGTPSPVEPVPAPDQVVPEPPQAEPIGKHSRTGAAWVALVVAAVVLIFLLVFVVQNADQVQVRYFGFEGSLPLGVAMLFAAVAGALTAGLLGTVRILQLRARARRTGTPT